MDTAHTFRGLLSILLTAALVFSCLAVPARADTIPEDTAATEPAETEETLPETIPPETAEETVPETTEETVPETTAPQQTPTVVTIALARAMAEGTDTITVQGTVVYASNGITVLQDQTGGIRLTFPEDRQLSAGLVLRVTGCRSAGGLEVESWETRGRADLPAEEAAIGSIPECQRVALKNVSFHSGFLIQGAASIPMTPLRPEGVEDGDTVNVWGVMVDRWFYADTVLPAEETAQPAPVTATPATGLLLPGENIALHCAASDAVIYYSYSYNGTFYSDYTRYNGGIPVDADAAGIHVRAYAVTPEGTAGAQSEFYFQWETREETESNTESNTETGDGWNLYFGQLHAHTSLSDGTGTVEEAFAYASRVPGLDFFAVTEHSNSLDNDDAGAIGTDGKTVSQEWAAGKAAAAAVTDGDFLGIFGYEMSWSEMSQLGHINTFNTPGWQSSTQAGFSTLESYYQALTTVPGSVSQFNHPGTTYGYFENFSHYSPKYDPYIQLLEVGSENEYTAYNYYTRALDAGWHVAPSNNQANHQGNWGDASSARTVVLAKALTEERLYEAIRSYRVYATEDSDLEILYYLDGQIMGSILTSPAQTVTVSLSDPTDAAVGTVEVVADGGVTIARRQLDTASGTLTIPVSGSYSYYFLRVTQPDGDIAVTAPVWVDTTVDVGIGSFSADTVTPTQGQTVQLTLELYNRESVPFLLESLTFSIGGQIIHQAENPGTAAALEDFSYTFPLQYNGFGAVEVLVSITGSLSGTEHTFTSTLSLNYQAVVPETSLSTIAYARKGTAGQVYRVKGYVTAGNSNPYTTFPGTIYLQDSTGGIAIVSFTGSGIQIGAPMEVTGYLAYEEGNPVLQTVSYDVLNEDYYRFVPEILSGFGAMTLESYGGTLLQVEGQVLSLTRTADSLGVSRFTLKDSQNGVAVVRIDDAIRSGTYGTNQLTAQVITGQYVRAIGILHRESDGTLVLRVRNCDEVTYVTASSTSGGTADLSNPKTGTDRYCAPFGAGVPTSLLLAVLVITAAGLAALYRLRKKR